MKRFLPTFLGISLLLFLFAVVLNKSQNASASTATNVVISEIQTSGATSTDDFIELYNPTSSDISLGDMRLVKRTSTGNTDTDIVAFTASDIIPAHGYFLWCNNALSVLLSCDKSSTDSISNSNSIAIRNEPANTGTIIDAVTFGTPDFPLGEGVSLSVPIASTSVERKAKNTSTQSSMGSGGADELQGNGEDTNDNSLDFVMRSISQPQNSLSNKESINIPSSTETPIPSPAPTLTPTNSPTPTETPSPTPSPTITPSATPSPTIFTSPTTTLAPTPSKHKHKTFFSKERFKHHIHYKHFKFFHKNITIPFIKYEDD